MAGMEYTPNCIFCGKEIKPTLKLDGTLSLIQTKFCSKSCRDKLDYQTSSIPATCKLCGNTFFAKRKVYTSFCSKRCASIFNQKIISEKEALLKIAKAKNPSFYKIDTLKQIASLVRIAKNIKYLKNKTSNYKTSKVCFHCNKKFVFTVKNGGPPKYCDICKPIVYAENTKRAAKIHKAKRRAIAKDPNAENINPFKVFDIYKWKCHICGCSTPKSKRGTYFDNAPELDHIVPLAKGGKHRMSNVACACRKCNQLKSDKPLGQLGLEFR
jgi:hypothetical protein